MSLQKAMRECSVRVINNPATGRAQKLAKTSSSFDTSLGLPDKLERLTLESDLGQDRRDLLPFVERLASLSHLGGAHFFGDKVRQSDVEAVVLRAASERNWDLEIEFCGKIYRSSKAARLSSMNPWKHRWDRAEKEEGRNKKRPASSNSSSEGGGESQSDSDEDHRRPVKSPRKRSRPEDDEMAQNNRPSSHLRPEDEEDVFAWCWKNEGTLDIFQIFPAEDRLIMDGEINAAAGGNNGNGFPNSVSRSGSFLVAKSKEEVERPRPDSVEEKVIDNKPPSSSPGGRRLEKEEGESGKFGDSDDGFADLETAKVDIDRASTGGEDADSKVDQGPNS